VSEALTSNCPVVLHARVDTGTGGGPDKTILNSPRFLRDLGYDSVCAYLHPPNDPGFGVLKQRAAELEAELMSISDRGLTDVSVIGRMLRLCRDRNVSIWHGHDYKFDALGLLLRRFHPMKLVSTVHGWGVRSRKTPLYHAIDRFSLKSYDRVICVSDKLLYECLAAGVPVGNCCEINNAIDVAGYNFLPSKDDVRDQLGIDPEKPTIVAVGRLSKEKAFDILIRAFDDLLETGLDATLVIAGDGPERDALHQLIKSLGREGSVQLTGQVADPRTVYAAADVFALSSLSEDLPNSLLEAMACGVPVVATTVGAVSNVVTNDFNGLLVEPVETAPLALALARLLSNSALQDQLATNGRSTIEQRFSFAGRMQKIAAIYGSVLPRQDFANGQVKSGTSAAEWRQHIASGASPRIDVLTKPESREAATAVSLDDQRVAGLDASATAIAVPTQNATVRSISTAVIADPTVRVELTSTPDTWQNFLTSKGHAGFYQQAEWLRVLHHGLGHQPVAAGILIHGPGVTQVPSASLLRRFNSTSANMLMYWHLLARSIERGQRVFDFGRSSKDAGTHKFKAQWGATEFPAIWQHFVRQGAATDMRPNSGKYDLMIRTWQKLPVWLTKVIGPSIVRGIP
jgi:glycosyltransferase involved in cell wall biosynthesis